MHLCFSSYIFEFPTEETPREVLWFPNSIVRVTKEWFRSFFLEKKVFILPIPDIHNTTQPNRQKQQKMGSVPRPNGMRPKWKKKRLKRLKLRRRKMRQRSK